MINKIEFDYTSKTIPMNHQIDVIEYIKRNNIIPLFDEQGLGKSKMVIDALCSNIEKKEIDGSIIVCKKSLLYTWKNEIEKHSHLFPVVLEGTKNRRNRSFLTFSHFYIVNYESLIQEIEIIKLVLKHKNYAVVLDESHKIKNPKAKVTKAILSLKDLSTKKIIITGTPIANKPEDIWTQFYFLDNGKLLGDDYKTFKKKYSTNLRETTVDIYTNNIQELRNIICRNSIRRTKDILELPDKKYFEVYIKLSPIQQKIYDTAKDNLYYEIKNTADEIIFKNIDNYLVKLLRLTQIASNPSLIDSSYNEDPSKFIKLDEILKNIIDKNEKAIIWTSFKKNIRTLKRRYKNFGALIIFGEITIEDRNKSIIKFMESQNYKVLIANPAAAKEGLTLTAANNAIYLDRNFKMDDYLQSQDRIHRISQTKRCNIIKLLAKNTIDEYTDEIIDKKELIAKYSLGDNVKKNTSKTFLSKKDLLEILGV